VNRRAHAFARLLHRDVGQPDDVEATSLPGMDVHLDVHQHAVQPDQGTAVNAGEHGNYSFGAESAADGHTQREWQYPAAAPAASGSGP